MIIMEDQQLTIHMIRKDELTYHISVDSIVMQELNSLLLDIQT